MHTEKVFNVLLGCENSVLHILSIEVLFAVHELVSRRLAVLEVHAQLWKREMSICSGSSNGAGCASLRSHLDVDGVADKVRDCLVPNLLVEHIGRAKCGVLTTNMRKQCQIYRFKNMFGASRWVPYLRLASCSRMLCVVSSLRFMVVAFGAGLVG